MDSTTADRVLKLPIDSPFDTHRQPDRNEDSNQNSDKRPLVTVTDQSLSAAAAKGASVQDTWGENFNEPLPTNKEDRIKQALEFMRGERQAFAADKNIKKHSIRQIAMFFQVPKSTLYDRLKNKSIDSQVNDGRIYVGPTYSVSSRAHSQQMKLSPEKEVALLDQLHHLCHALGNTLNLTHIRDFIVSLVEGISLGKKWVHNFNRRHDDAVIYGTNSSHYSIRMFNSKSSRSNFDNLWKCFVPLLQERVRQIPPSQPFYYITRACFHQASMSSIFTCFKIMPEDTSISLLCPPKVIIFPDYFGKVYLQLRDLKHDENHFRDVDEDVEDQSSASSSIISESNGRGDRMAKDHNNIDHNRINSQEKLQKEFKQKKLNEAFQRIYAECCSQGSNQDDVPLVIFEGFEDRYNWDPLTCRSIVVLGKFLALPWNQQVLQKFVITELQPVVEELAQSASITATQLPSMEVDLGRMELDLDPFVHSLRRLLQSHTEVLPSGLNHNGVLVNDIFASALPQSPPPPPPQSATTTSTTTTTAPPAEHHQAENSTSANIFEDSTLSQLQEVLGLIEHNESQIYRELPDGSHSKTVIPEIFNKIRGILPQ
ncbi:hypothetical protein ZYGR_0AF02640 [Zygosaccharomyces rouxii]|uniref:Uncharacterized protein n=1 Tax=Zygosaccharomyces rouxii TaxID=4956 RepID=A0A1Q3A8B2_ZYGRO|nr:hypothetical protein ZYGR_0AF02640 [Zygosaccharomyces rouxii]